MKQPAYRERSGKKSGGGGSLPNRGPFSKLRLLMIIYPGAVDNAHQLIQFFRREADRLHALKKVVISRDSTVVKDVNGDGIAFPGLTYGCATLDELLRELGVVFSPGILHNPGATACGVKEFVLSARWTWGHDRVL